MLDLDRIRQDPQGVEQALRRRDPSIQLQPVLELDSRRRQLLNQVEGLRNQSRIQSREIGRADRNDPAVQARIAELRELSRRIRELEDELQQVEGQLRGRLLRLPNLPHPDVPVGEKEAGKVVLRQWGQRRDFGFAPKHHMELNLRLHLFDFERAAKMAASQFPMYVGPGAQLEWSLIRFMMDVNTREKRYTLVIPPYLVNEQSGITAGSLPKFEDVSQLYKCAEDELYLIPTSEVPLANMHRDEILEEQRLPLYYTAYTANFRREAGTYGATERGLIRVHQFNKMELFKYTTPETSYQELESLVADAEDLVQRLGLPGRTVRLVASDMAQQAAMTIDVEVWLPGQGAFYEVSSCSNCEDYQARRGSMRYRPAGGGRPRFVHTLNGSGLATSRLMVAVLETYQEEDGSVTIPEVLRPYMGCQRISPC